MKYHCIDCHFLAQSKPTGELVSVNRDQRRALKQAPNSADAGMCSSQLACYHNIWMQASSAELMQVDRKGQCFFYWHKARVALATAAQRQKTAPDPPPEGYALIGERPWVIWLISIVALIVTLIWIGSGVLL